MVCILAAAVIVVGLAACAVAESRMKVVVDAGSGVLKILKDICKEYRETGKVDDETVYIAAIYYEFYLGAHRTWATETLLEQGKSIDTAKDILSSSAGLLSAFDDMFMRWIESKNPAYAEAIMSVIMDYINEDK